MCVCVHARMLEKLILNENRGKRPNFLVGIECEILVKTQLIFFPDYRVSFIDEY